MAAVERRGEDEDRRVLGVPAGLARRLGLGAISGYAAYPAGLLGDRLEDVAPLSFSNWSTVLIGMSFGAIALSAFVTAASARTLRVLALAGASTFVYGLTVWLAVGSYGPLHLGGAASIVASGALGALLVTAAVVAVAPRRAAPWLWPCALAAGAGGGAIFELAMRLDSGPEALVVGTGYAVWQALVCLVLDRGTSRP
jgi:hypothetical protein